MSTILLALLLQATASQTPDAEALALGQRLAAAGALAAMLPSVTAKETEELVKDHPELDAADQAALRDTARKIAASKAADLSAAMGRGYALNLSKDDLRALVAFVESPVARRWRVAEPAAFAVAAGALGEIDYKGSVMQAFCRDTGRGCAGK